MALNILFKLVLAFSPKLSSPATATFSPLLEEIEAALVNSEKASAALSISKLDLLTVSASFFFNSFSFAVNSLSLVALKAAVVF